MLIENSLTAEGVTSHLKTGDINLSIFESVTSTNTLLKEMAINGAKEGAVIIALSQTAGRGRYGRKFYSDKGGIYLSALFNPNTNGFDITLLTSAAAVAVSDAIESVSGKTTQIKWVNDILIENKKACGILCEGGFIGDSSFVIVGIGINAYKTESGFNDKIKDIATTVFNAPCPELCEKLCATVIDNLFYHYKNLEKREFLNKYRQKNIVIGKNVTVIPKHDAKTFAKVLEIDDNCRLLLEFEDGKQQYLSTGEISVKL